ncbi:MAG: TetR family transcriptional regulator, partial [Lachnospiraceae bacterium]|nr:TetR family transcriptional regulator [Lachnospiraceae bacterium]
MARPVKKPPEQWKREILDAAQKLFLKKGYEETAVSDI